MPFIPKVDPASLIPMDARLLIKPIQQEDRMSSGGIFIPADAEGGPQLGKVITMGDSSHKIDELPLSDLVHVGDTVVYARYGGTELNIDDESYFVIKRTDILVVIPHIEGE